MDLSEKMPEERQRRFWVRFFLLVRLMLYLKLFKHNGIKKEWHKWFGDENASPDAEKMPEERQRRWWGGNWAPPSWGNEAASPDVESAAENLHNTYAAMTEKRQRRFWVRFFYKSRKENGDFNVPY